MTAPQSVYDLRSIAEHVLHSKRRKGEDTTDARMLMGAATVAIGAYMFWGAFNRKHQAEQPWAMEPHGPLTPRRLR